MPQTFGTGCRLNNVLRWFSFHSAPERHSVVSSLLLIACLLASSRNKLAAHNAHRHHARLWIQHTQLRTIAMLLPFSKIWSRWISFAPSGVNSLELGQHAVRGGDSHATTRALAPPRTLL